MSGSKPNLAHHKTIELTTLKSTERFAVSLAELAISPMTIALNGTLGSGKTQWTRFFCQALGVAPALVTSPSYVLLQIYHGREKIYHFDFYRLESEAAVWDLGIDELYEQNCWVIIEWANKFPQCLPADYLEIMFEHGQAELRQAHLHPQGPNAVQLAQGM
jgi:tRNA threonylcarbamoyladenosine biosynthesis protein TsaE